MEDDNMMSENLIQTQKYLEFIADSYKTLLSTNILLYKLINLTLILIKVIRKTYTYKYNIYMPDKSTLRKYYINNCYNQIIDKIKITLRRKTMCGSIDG